MLCEHVWSTRTIHGGWVWELEAKGWIPKLQERKLQPRTHKCTKCGLSKGMYDFLNKKKLKCLLLVRMIYYVYIINQEIKNDS